MNEENIIKTIEIEIAGVTVKVTPEQLQNLHSAIGTLLNLKTEKVVEREVIRDRYVPQPYPVYPTPRPIWYFNTNGTAVNIPSNTYSVSYLSNTGTAKLSV